MRSPVFLFRDLGVAVRFLTAIPWPGAPPSGPAAVARSAWAFPLAGLAVGACSVLAGAAGERFFGSPLHVVAAIAASVIVTAGLHLDGLADSADALFSWRSRERKLEILRDSRIGTMGALALFLILVTKLGALLALGPSWWKGALLAPVGGRWSVVYGMAFFPPVRPEGLGAGIRSRLRVGQMAPATLLAMAIGAALSPTVSALVALVALAATHAAARAMTRSLGGLTGDTYGALSEIVEVTVLMAYLALQHSTALR